MLKKVKNLFWNDNSKNIYEEIWAYFEFHNEINKYFNEGINLEPTNYEQEIYFIDYKWIKSWKKYTKYENIINMEKNYDFLKKNGFLEYNENPNFEGIKTGNSNIIFLSKTVLKIEDFDCLIDHNTYNYFKRYKKNEVPILDSFHNNIFFYSLIYY